MTSPLPIAVLISGTGRSLQNLIDRIEAGRLRAEIRLVISSNPQAGGLQHARRTGIPAEVVERRRYDSQEAFGETIYSLVRNSGAELIVMAGFLKLLPVAADFRNRIINIHPALIPAFSGRGFYGSRVHQAAIDRGVKVSGCTVHFVDEQYDHGPILLQRTVAVQEDFDAETLAAAVFAAELEALPEAINLIADRRVQIEDRRVRVLPPDTPRQ